MNNSSARKPGLVEASSWLFAMTMGANIFTYIFHALAGRVLGPAEYGGMVSMLAIITVMFIPGQAIQAVIAREVARHELQQKYNQIVTLSIVVFKHVIILGFAIFVGLSLVSTSIAKFFQIDSNWPVIAVGLVFMVVLLLPVIRGVLQGLQKFGLLGINLLADSGLRLVAGLILFMLGARVTGGILAGGIGGLLAGLVVIFPLGWLWKYRTKVTKDINIKAMYQYGLPVVATFGAFTALYTLDVIIVKHYFDPTIAGYYSAAALVGKAFLFLPYATTQVLFPKVSAGHSQNEDTKKLLNKSLLLTAGALGLGIITVWLLAPFVILSLFGKEFLNHDTLWLVRWFGIAISPLALVFVIMQYHLATKNIKFAILLIIDIPLFMAGMILFHSDILQILALVGCNHVLLLLGSILFTWRK